MARPKPSAPSPRVYAAFAVAAVLGLAIFLIWWLTVNPPVTTSAPIPPATPVPSPPSKEAIIEAALPRGGSLTGSAEDMASAAEWLTGAPLARVNRSTDQIEPWLAESWIASADNLVYTVKLRPGLISAGGQALTAADAAASLAGLTALDKPVAVRPIDALTIEIRFSSPFAPGLRLLDRYPIEGFGPFVETPAPKRPGRRTFERNARYWRRAADGSPLPYLDEIVLTQARLKSSPTEIEDFDEMPIRPEDFEAIKKVEQSGKLRLFELGPGLDADALWFSQSPSRSDERPWLTHEKFRLAISAAVDRRQYCKQVFYGACDPIATPVSPANVAWFNPDFPLGPGNPQLARAMLAELGLRDRTGDGFLDDATLEPLRFTLLIRRDVSASARAARFLADTLKTMGVQIEIAPVDAKTLAARLQKGTYDAIYDRVEFRDTDPAMNLDFWLSTGQQQIDLLMLKNATTFNRAERLQAFVDAQKIYLQRMPAVFFGAAHVRIATRMRTLNATPSPLRPHLLWNAENLAALASW